MISCQFLLIITFCSTTRLHGPRHMMANLHVASIYWRNIACYSVQLYNCVVFVSTMVVTLLRSLS